MLVYVLDFLKIIYWFFFSIRHLSWPTPTAQKKIWQELSLTKIHFCHLGACKINLQYILLSYGFGGFLIKRKKPL